MSSIEQLKAREERIRGKIAGLGDAPDALQLRALKKSLRRTQRKRRSFVREEERRAKASGKKTEDAAE
jgi:hypothetical protein